MAQLAEQYLRPDVIQQVRRLDLKARFIVEGLISGLHAAPTHGFSVEFSEHRKYVPGDDIRAVDWGVYAKTDRYYVRKYRAETNLQAYLLVDCSGSMDYASGGRMTKMEYAICLAAALGYLCVQQQDAVGLALFDEKLRHFLPPKAKRAHLTNVLALLARTKPFGETHLPEAIHDVARRVRKRGLMIVLSDLLADVDEVMQAIGHLRAGGHDVIVFQVLDYSERVLDFEGPSRFFDPETLHEIQADPAAIRAAYQDRITAFIDEYRTRCREARADFVPVHNAMTFDKALVEYLAQRRGRF